MTSSKVLLIVDDSRVSRMMIKGRVLIAHPDWVIHEAGNADEAIALAKSELPDFISMDVNMPGANGFEVVEQLRAIGSTAMVVMLTANVQQSSRDRAAKLGVHFVQKPATEVAVQQMLKHFEGTP